MESATAWMYLLLAGAGVAAGFINTIAAGGSMLTLPVLMLLGMPADVANGTNRLSIATQSVSGIFAFHRRGKLDHQAVLPVVIPVAVGALLGAGFATLVPERVLKPALLVTMLVTAFVIACSPQWSESASQRAPLDARKSHRAHAGLFFAGLYGGFIQAGVGFILLFTLVTTLGYDLLRANALKLVCALALGVIAVIVFATSGDVEWIPASVLAVSTVVGSQLGVRFALSVSPKVVRWIVLAAISTVCIAALFK
ncbi:MAG: sulfite exporter TauE/SafE family protein [Myxococcota bacterium]